MMYAGSKNRLVQTAELTKVGVQALEREGGGAGTWELQEEGSEVLTAGFVLRCLKSAPPKTSPRPGSERSWLSFVDSSDLAWIADVRFSKGLGTGDPSPLPHQHEKKLRP